jgi:hypothetical protein
LYRVQADLYATSFAERNLRVPEEINVSFLIVYLPLRLAYTLHKLSNSARVIQSESSEKVHVF